MREAAVEALSWAAGDLVEVKYRGRWRDGVLHSLSKKGEDIWWVWLKGRHFLAVSEEQLIERIEYDG